MDAETKVLIESYMDEAISAAVTDVRNDVRAKAEAAPCESPIEFAFFVWWHVLTAFSEARGITLKPQHPVVMKDFTEYRVDFEVGYPLNGGRQVAVELDGHDFHERTKEQVKHRDKRDRDLQRAGWKVFHFSGSEIHHNCAGCAQEVLTYVRKLRPAILQ